MGKQIFHVIGRGNRRQNIFEEDADRVRFWASIVAECAAEGVTVFVCVLMDNHYHLVVLTEMDPLSCAMHRAETSHAVYMNKKYGRTGHLFEDRFKALLVEPEGLKPLARYVHLNPVRAHMVEKPEQWRWSTHSDYLKPGSQTPSGRIELLGRFATDESVAIAAYQEYMKPAPRPKASPGQRVPLGVLAAYIEREGGHKPGFLKERAHRRDVLGIRKKFADMAEEEGYEVEAVAAFLGVSKSAVYYAQRVG